MRAQGGYGRTAFLTEKSEMSIPRNTLYNLFGSLIPLVMALATIPFYISAIGESRYGVLAIIWLLLGYFGIFDLGLGRATAQRIARLQNAPLEQQARALRTALVLNGTFGVVGGIVLWPAASYFFTQHFKIDGTLGSEVVAATPWLILALPVATISGVLLGALQGKQKFLLLNTISTFGSILFQLLPLAAAYIWTPDLRVILPAAVLSRVPPLLASLHCCRKHVTSDTDAAFCMQEARELVSFGGWITVSSFISPLMVMVDRFITGSILGAKEVAYYTVPYQLAERTTIIPAALASSLFPRFPTLQPHEQRDMAEEALRTLIVIITPLTVLAITIARPFLSFWVSTEFSKHSAGLAAVLFSGFWINGLARIPHAQLQAIGRPAIVAKIHVAEIVPYILLLYAAIRYYGLMGAAFAFSARLCVDFLLLARCAGILRQVAPVTAGASVFLVIAVALAESPAIDGSRRTQLVVALLLTLTAWCFRNTPAHLRAQITKRFRFPD